MSSNIIHSFPMEKIAPSEEIEKGTRTLDDMDDTKSAEKLELPVLNDLVAPKIIRNNRGMIWMIKKQLRTNF